ncbi:N-acetylmuramoyl-L-alanine amidase [Aureibaculum marinum]|uniref:N-acetylmuramoyl-L-alanine amidase n=1 Tax=Aureibaculum marinum TaxID=2487930 RepID=A0A3N4NWL1_9FLAO|nr:N-acetylmuramoyl-L-alanine amidase [Aureibaculum marinum]RPD98648.1 N-acetylmuramoyl-L-alanine amidase [Aureibaculum marinum]
MNNSFSRLTNKKFIFLLFVLIIGLQTSTIYAQQKFKVVIDAGHGGTDPGNTGNGYSEKDIVLKIALEVGKLLKADNSIEVIYTRDDDTFVELHERGSIAQKSKADLFVSIHCDAFHKSSVHGAGTFVLGLHENDRNFEIAKKENSVILLEDNYKANYDGFDPNSPEAVIGLTLMQEEYLDQSLALASLIQKNMVGLGRKDRMVKQAGFLVLRNTFMPSVLIETGFLTNKLEGAYLNSKKGQQEVAKSIYKAIKSYKKQIDANTVVDVPPVKKEPKEDNKSKTRIIKGVDFKVQIASSTKRISTEHYNFKGLKGVERVRVGAHHKYYYGFTSDYNKALAYRAEAKSKGYKGAFIVAFKNKKKISVKEALASK